MKTELYPRKEGSEIRIVHFKIHCACESPRDLV